MVVDDHDVTDDWNLGRAWRDRVFTARARPPHHHLRARRLRRVPGLGQRPAALPRRAVPGRLLDARLGVPAARAREPRRQRPRQAAEKLLAKLFGLNQPDPGGAGAAAQVALLDRRPAPPRARARHAHAPRLPLALPAARPALAEGARGADPRPGTSTRCRPGIEMLVVVSQTPPVLPTIATRYIVPVEDARPRSSTTTRSSAGSPASSPTTRSGPATTSPTRRC